MYPNNNSYLKNITWKIGYEQQILSKLCTNQTIASSPSLYAHWATLHMTDCYVPGVHVSLGYRFCIDNHMNVSAINDLHYKWYWKILSKLHEPVSECNLKELSNIASRINP